jgi:dipeptidyl aminopeptidase/acylaminoacyl peptidase
MMATRSNNNRQACRRPLSVVSASFAAILFFHALSSIDSAEAQARKIQISDYPKIVAVSDPEISPNGKSIVFITSRANMDQDRRDRQLLLIDVASGQQRPLTYEREGVASPRWSPSGDRIAFLVESGSEKEKKRQIFVLRMDGGEAKKITSVPNGVEQFAWRPHGEEIAFVTPDEAPNKKEIEKHNDAFEVGDNDFLVTAAPTPSHIWIVPADGGEPRRLTSGSWSLPKSNPPGSPNAPIHWSPDGRHLTFTKRLAPHTGDSDLSTVQILDVDSGQIRPLTSHQKFEGYGLYSPDGSQIAYRYPENGDQKNQSETYITAVSGGDGASATHAVDRLVSRAVWMPDGKSLLIGGHDGPRVSLWIQPLHSAARHLEIGDISPSWSFWIDMSVGSDGAIAFTGSTPLRPSELYYLPNADAAPRRLTDFNHEIAALSLGRSEEIKWQGPDGFREDGIVVYPPEFVKDKKYPLVLYIHGGPRASSTDSFSFLPQLLAANGYVVFQPNYRGSDNLGNAYESAIHNDMGNGPGRDVMAGLEALEKMGFVDQSRIGVSGWSYGGYMTTWMIGHYQVWKAAVAGAAVTNWLDQYNLADGNVLGRYNLEGSPWAGDKMKAYREQSPITYAQQIKTPTLILSDTGDFRVTITQSYQLYHALKDNGVTTRFFAYPVRGHFPEDPVRTMDIYARWIEWLDHYLK